ncbi:DJ-1 family glyoxalase III [Oceanobacter sp. 3_MG-2023]|uniref:DJ-1 family glyoxalase III n=1 Tax=Oceanobacter sp. 3_MG-2023 TaxID=3062622 RepID=UPI0027369B62|nr:DJ-1 family glyoxalase III [Oceanobacter sp. 3_MG-2023]MDP2504833.1 DJ-1/PfpI family protein [Oceanobacter sp. 3_MG-2023]
MNALIAIANGNEELEVITLVNVLRRAGITVTLASTGPERSVRCARATVIEADCVLGKLAIDHPFDLIAIPGGMPGAANLATSLGLLHRLQQQNRAGKWIAAICAAPAVVLGAAGITAGRVMTGYPSFDPLLTQAGACINHDDDVVVDGNLITSRGPATALPLALTLVELLCGKLVRDDVAAAMLYQG